MAAGWFSTVVVSLPLRSWRGSEERDVAIVQNIEVTAPLYEVENNLNCIYKGLSSSEEINHGVCGKELEHRVARVWESYVPEHSSSIVYNVECTSCKIKSSRHRFTIALSGSKHGLIVHICNIDGTAQIDTKSNDCAEKNENRRGIVGQKLVRWKIK